MTTKTSTPGSATKPAKTFSCVRCFERKVKCDRDHPCAGCIRSGVECIFRVPAPPKRKKKRTQEDILTERLNQYEQILQQKGINLPPATADTEKSRNSSVSERNVPIAPSDNAHNAHGQLCPESGQRSFVAGKLIWDAGRSRYTENPLWTRVAEEFPTEQDTILESDDDEQDDPKDEIHEVEDNIEFTLGCTPSSTGTRDLHPPPNHILKLWEIYLENVNPFSMLCHRPTMTQTIQKAALNLDHVSKGMEAILFAVYSASILSMSARDVEDTFGQSRNMLLLRYRSATKSALARAKFMGSSDVLVLSAFIVHLLSMRDVYDSRTLWTLSGVALRIAEGMGFHRDGASLGLPPLKAELRRRAWYQITNLDYRSAELSGSNKIRGTVHDHVTTKPPLNINDEDIWPSMTTLPEPQEKVTDMVLCCMRYEFGLFWSECLNARREKGNNTIWEDYHTSDAVKEQDELIDQLERRLEERYVRYCDPSIPVQLMASLIARSATNSMRLMAHHPRRWKSDAAIPQSERQYLWALCIRIMEGYLMCITAKSLQRFIWHTSFYFQWQALIYMLDVLHQNPLTPGADEAWKILGDVFAFHSNFVTDTKKPIHVAVGSLCLKAYTAREQAYKREGRFLPARTPEYIAILRRQRDAAQRKNAERRARASNSASASAVSYSSTGPTPDSSTVSSDVVGIMGFEPSAAPTSTPSIPQLPLPDFPTSVPNPQQQQQFGTDTAPWFDDYNVAGPGAGMSMGMGMDADWIMTQDPILGDGQIDWSQWDYLLNDGGVGGPFTSLR